VHQNALIAQRFNGTEALGGPMGGEIGACGVLGDQDTIRARATIPVRGAMRRLQSGRGHGRIVESPPLTAPNPPRTYSLRMCPDGHSDHWPTARPRAVNRASPKSARPTSRKTQG
jgi:hypothetical protein